MRIVWDEKAWEDYMLMQSHEPQLVKKLNRLIRECQRMPFEGTGKPEALKYELTGHWSRRIDKEHRLVYRVENGMLVIVNCRSHYE